MMIVRATRDNPPDAEIAYWFQVPMTNQEPAKEGLLETRDDLLDAVQKEFSFPTRPC
ncbi:hypothetical protein GX48_02619 [Paracoccidioides brasiliensis]|nr:hypothetical protein GX48_02619 [Paracoccidioides brasiliensis]